MDETDRRTNETIARACGVDLTEYPAHDWATNGKGRIDYLAYEAAYHNGPVCKRCGHSYCKHCSRDGAEKRLPCRTPLPDYIADPARLPEMWALCKAKGWAWAFGDGPKKGACGSVVVGPTSHTIYADDPQRAFASALAAALESEEGG